MRGKIANARWSQETGGPAREISEGRFLRNALQSHPTALAHDFHSPSHFTALILAAISTNSIKTSLEFRRKYQLFIDQVALNNRHRNKMTNLRPLNTQIYDEWIPILKSVLPTTSIIPWASVSWSSNRETALVYASFFENAHTVIYSWYAARSAATA